MGQGWPEERALRVEREQGPGEGKRGKKAQGAGTGGGVRQAWGGRAPRYPFAGQSERSVGRCHGKPAGWVGSQHPLSGQGAGAAAATEAPEF